MDDIKSIIQSNKEKCFICKRNANASYWGLDEHHVFFGPYRKAAEKYGLKIYICHETCHIFGKNSVHKNAKVDRAVKSFVQKKAMQHYGWSVEEFIAIFGKNYL